MGFVPCHPGQAWLQGLGHRAVTQDCAPRECHSCWLKPQLRPSQDWDRKYPQGAVEGEQVLPGVVPVLSAPRGRD